MIQNQVLYLLIQEQIQAAWKAANLNSEYENISQAAIRTCYKRSALSLYWEKGKLYGNEPFLSDYDINVLQNTLKIEQKIRNQQIHLNLLKKRSLSEKTEISVPLTF